MHFLLELGIGLGAGGVIGVVLVDALTRTSRAGARLFPSQGRQSGQSGQSGIEGFSLAGQPTEGPLAQRDG